MKPGNWPLVIPIIVINGEHSGNSFSETEEKVWLKWVQDNVEEKLEVTSLDISFEEFLLLE